MKHALTPLTLTLIALCSSAQAERVVFNMIPGANSANDMSPDGRYIVGESDADGNGFPDGAYLLDRVTGVITDLSSSGQGLNAVAVSDDGSVVVGDILDPDFAISNLAGRWTAAEGWQSLGYLPNAGTCPSRSDSYEISADGSVVVGLSWDGCSGRGFRWTQATGMQELQNLANGNNRASVVSADGSLIGGFAQGTFDRTPAIWHGDLSGELLDPPSGDASGEINGIRDDGSVLLGRWLVSGDLASKASLWRAGPAGWEREQIAGGSLLPGWAGNPLDIADNDTIVGFDSLLGNRRAWIQPNGEGPLLDLRNYFISKGATIPQGLVIEVPQAISADGHYIIGHGAFTGAWIATILSDCDFDGDVQCDIEDLDALIMAISTGSTDLQFDLTSDGRVDLNDRDAWLVQAGAENLTSGNAYKLGDANLDGAVDGNDFILWNASKFTSTGKWSMGDFDASGFTDGSDFILWNANKFTGSDQAAVPEPAQGWLLLLSTLCVRRRRPSSQQAAVPRPSSSRWLAA